MMTVNFMPVDVTTYLQCRRGRNTFRRVRIDIGMKQAIYNALPQTSLEIVDATGHVWSRGDIQENRGPITLDFQGQPKPDPRKVAKALRKEAAEDIADKATFNERLADLEKKQEDQYKKNHAKVLADKANALANKEANEGTTTPEPDQRPKAKDDDDMQQVGGERHTDGEAIRRPVHVQVPFVGKVDARLERTEERGSEGGSDGLHSSNDEPRVLDNRYAPRVRLVSPADEDAGRD